jgi:hypothetical protein
MNRRVRHKFERLKKLAKSQKDEIISIQFHQQPSADEPPHDTDNSKDAENFSVAVSIAVKQQE